MSKRFIDSDGVRRTDIQFDETDDSFNFKTTQDVTPVLEENKEKYNSYGDKLSLGKRGEWRRILNFWLLTLMTLIISISK